MEKMLLEYRQIYQPGCIAVEDGFAPAMIVNDSAWNPSMANVVYILSSRWNRLKIYKGLSVDFGRSTSGIVMPQSNPKVSKTLKGSVWISDGWEGDRVYVYMLCLD